MPNISTVRYTMLRSRERFILYVFKTWGMALAQITSDPAVPIISNTADMCILLMFPVVIIVLSAAPLELTDITERKPCDSAVYVRDRIVIPGIQPIQEISCLK